MAKRQRDYRAEYARRVAKAQRQGYSGYSQKRRIYERFQRAAATATERLASPSYFREYFEAEGIEDLLDDDSLFWEAFRNYYGKGTPA